ncbi:hypothetical protein IWT25_02308 [Secundilactobacillus pentosiphilus]|uniref:Uncharacterized protein n=1 Tax=Secundilactobacillus pentosiphilus TaxID=1714682 RepID=A0A1Z5IYQ1_9LACO|nr:hypothetical protein [Secundilactobacillus pentosiphilus]GAX06960.1 hypothetical protein IWT25_02308 [Secundilactobacillus pentosiphilus]
MANNRWRSLRKASWGLNINLLDGSYVGWHTRRHKNFKRDRYRGWKRASVKNKIPYHAKLSQYIKAVQGGRMVAKSKAINSTWSGGAIVTKITDNETINIYTDLKRGDHD